MSAALHRLGGFVRLKFEIAKHCNSIHIYIWITQTSFWNESDIKPCPRKAGRSSHTRFCTSTKYPAYVSARQSPNLCLARPLDQQPRGSVLHGSGSILFWASVFCAIKGANDKQAIGFGCGSNREICIYLAGPAFPVRPQIAFVPRVKQQCFRLIRPKMSALATWGLFGIYTVAVFNPESQKGFRQIILSDLGRIRIRRTTEMKRAQTTWVSSNHLRVSCETGSSQSGTRNKLPLGVSLAKNCSFRRKVYCGKNSLRQKYIQISVINSTSVYK